MRLLRMGFVALGLPWLMAAAAPPAPMPASMSAPVSAPAPSAWQSAPAGPVSAEAASPAPVLRRDLAPVTPAPSLRTGLAADPAPVTVTPVSAAPVTAAPVPLLRAAAPANAYGPQRMGFADGVSAQFDVTYQTLPGFRPLTLDIYQPRLRAPSGSVPLVVFVHGGAFQGGDSRHAGSFEDFPRILAGLAAQGYVVASINYRLSGEARFPAAVQDVKAAIRWLGAHADTYNIDATRIAVWGAGSGGQLAALTGVTCGVGLFEPEAAAPNSPSDCVQAVIDWSGASDLKSLAGDNGKPAAPAGGFAATPTTDGGEFLGCEPANCPPALARLASPLGYVKATSPAFLIQHGAADTAVSAKQAQKLYDALTAAGTHAQLVIYPGVGAEFRRGGVPDPATDAQAMAQVTAFLAVSFPYAPLAGRAAPVMRRTVQN